MADASTFLSVKRYAVVTGANKGIGLEVCRQLASQGVVVVLTARNENRGREAMESLKKSGIDSENIEFHQLDVRDPASGSSLAEFIRAKFGKLDILVNNAAVLGAIVDFHAVKALQIGVDTKLSSVELVTQTNEMSEDCLNTNYYGVKRTTESLLPLLQLSDSPRIVTVSSIIGRLEHIPSEGVKELLGNAENHLNEERVDDVVNEFLRDFKDGSYTEKGWPSNLYPAYTVSKAAVNAYMRILAKKNPSIIINCLCPGYVKTDINDNTGIISLEEGGESCVRLALLPQGSYSGLFFIRNEVSSF